MEGTTFKKDGKEYDINTTEGRKKFLEGKKLMFACCFCTKGIDADKYSKNKAPPIVNLTLDRNGQIFWSHESCLKKRMTEFCRKLIK